MAKQNLSPTEVAGRSDERSPDILHPAEGRSTQPPTTPRWRRFRPLVATLVVITLVLGTFIYAGSQPDTQTVGGGPAPDSLIQQVSDVNPSTMQAVAAGGLSNPLSRITTASLLQSPTGKPQVLYVGAEYCPFCAAERWSLIVALGRFGAFQHLQLTTSSATDLYPNTATFTFYHSAYTSQYIDFQSVEETARDQSLPLQTPSASQKQIIHTYDAMPYIPAGKAGGIPFVDIGNQYVTVGSGYSPQLLSGLSWQQIASRLDKPNDPVTRNIVGNANYLTAAICQITGNQPSSVCTVVPIPQIQQQLA